MTVYLSYQIFNDVNRVKTSCKLKHDFILNLVVFLSSQAIINDYLQYYVILLHFLSGCQNLTKFVKFDEYVFN